MSQQLTAASASQVTREFGVHSLLVDYSRRSVEIYSDMNASGHAIRRDWRAVCSELRKLGAKLSDETGFAPGLEVAYGSF